jgi:hypothetical protein
MEAEARCWWLGGRSGGGAGMGSRPAAALPLLGGGWEEGPVVRSGRAELPMMATPDEVPERKGLEASTPAARLAGG